MFVRLRCLLTVGLTIPVCAATYEVGPGKANARLRDVAWGSLQPGDTVLIHWRAEPYKERVLICARGTAKAPITVRGVPGSGGQLPVIDGREATSDPTPGTWDNGRSVVQIGNANYEPGALPAYITLENLDIRSGRPPYAYIAADGSTKPYRRNAASVYVSRGENLIIRGCVIRDSSNGLMIGSSDRSVSANILVEGNYIHDNGNEGSIYEHNSYTAARGITFQFNRYGPLRAGAGGNNLKDRSVGLVIRYNWIEGGNRQLDIVDAEDSIQLRQDPSYRTTFVYGNVLVEPDGAGNRQIVHYGGDSRRVADYRKGILYFYNNTVVSHRQDRTALFRLSTNEERCDARNNIVYTTAPGETLALLESAGVLDLGRNWIKRRWRESIGALEGRIDGRDRLVEGDDPGFAPDDPPGYRLSRGSPCAGAGERLVKTALPVQRQYVIHQSGEARKRTRDLGAFELRVK